MAGRNGSRPWRRGATKLGWAVQRRDDKAAEQGDEADEARSTSELRSLSPVFDGLRGARRR